MNIRVFDHFLRMAEEQTRMSTDPSTRVGAVIVGPKHELRAAGCNSFPHLICESPERMNDREMKLKLIVHAEMNAVLAAARVGIPLAGCTLYLAATDDTGAVWGGPPCTRCTVELIQAGITRIVSRPKKAVPSRWHDDLLLSRQLLDEAGIEYLELPA
jgi:dCMP deaminase